MMNVKGLSAEPFVRDVDVPRFRKDRRNDRNTKWRFAPR
jgi:hypothetical protein